jgi:hypothetical protein
MKNQRKQPIPPAPFIFINRTHCLKGNSQRECAAAALSGISGYYEFLDDFGHGCPRGCVSCFALVLAQCVMSAVKESSAVQSRGESWLDGFLGVCLEKIEQQGLFCEVDDRELMTIHVKQMIMMLRAANIIAITDSGPVLTDAQGPPEGLYLRLFGAFWNDCSWSGLFPSYPAAAVELKKNRSRLIAIILALPGGTDIETICSRLVSLTGFSANDDPFVISFLDFSVMTWLRHFGIIRYGGSGQSSSPSIVVTPAGKKILNYFS